MEQILVAAGIDAAMNIAGTMWQATDQKCDGCGCKYTMRRTLGIKILGIGKQHHQYSCPGRLGLPTLGARGCQWTRDVDI
jgi:hypothetical protein